MEVRILPPQPILSPLAQFVMPGIVGIVTKMARERATAQLLRMVRALCHENFYVKGVWIDAAMGVYVGWVSRRGSFSDGMPITNERRDAVLIFSGEEFSEPGTVHRLRRRGHVLETNGPSYLIHLYEEDESFPAPLNGRFQGLLIDQKRRRAFLFNDRYGISRLYYHEAGAAFYFAAEAKAILAVRPELRKLDPKGTGELITCGCTLENRSLFDGIHVLPGGSKWVFRKGSVVEKQRYFDPAEWENQDLLEPEHYYNHLRNTFSWILPRYFGGEERIAVSLTGGLDTRMIMAWLKPELTSVPSYTFGGLLRDCQDVRIASQVAAEFRQQHQVIRAETEFFPRFPDYAARAVYLTDGCADVSRAPDVYLNARAREISPIRMTGLFGGELLRGVRAFKPVDSFPGLFAPALANYVQEANGTYATLLRTHPTSFAVFKQAPWHHYGMLALEQTQVSIRTPFLDNDLVRSVYRAPGTALRTNEISLRLIADGNPALLDIPTDRGLGGRRRLLSRIICRAWQESLFKAEYVFDMGMPQWLARLNFRLSPLQLERLFLGRHKISHFRIWYRDILGRYVQELLLDPLSLNRPYINRKALEHIVQHHLKGDRNYTSAINLAMTLELVHRLLLDHAQRDDGNDQPVNLEIATGDHFAVACKEVGGAGADPEEPCVSG